MVNSGFEYRREANGVVRIIPTMGKLPTIKEYEEAARNLLTKGLINQRREKLKDLASNDFGDTLGLIGEFEEFSENVNMVVFSYGDRDIRVTQGNIDQVDNILKAQSKSNSEEMHKVAVREAVEEALLEIY